MKNQRINDLPWVQSTTNNLLLYVDDIDEIQVRTKLILNS
jgi:hypothetical protein